MLLAHKTSHATLVAANVECVISMVAPKAVVIMHYIQQSAPTHILLDVEPLSKASTDAVFGRWRDG